jgi:hypothetical protein
LVEDQDAAQLIPRRGCELYRQFAGAVVGQGRTANRQGRAWNSLATRSGTISQSAA